ncbi:MAG TPA: DegT/DnrJ/EryC1/StrS family aminotransferase [Terriglobia bacterium]|nr:DegT/DnrJ/EryC1/StrS family aminotransferase [Terriglobia bacterium]
MTEQSECAVADRQAVAGSADRKPSPSIPAGPALHTFWKGRVALYAALKSLGVGTGQCVIVPAYTCFAVPLAVQLNRARPVYADIDPSTFDLTLDSVEAAWNHHRGDSIKALIIQHTYGIPADSRVLVDWAHARGIGVVEDCAHVCGGSYRDNDGTWRPVGSFGDIAMSSSHWSKPVSTGLGGWATTSNPELSRKLDSFREGECLPPTWRESASLAAAVALRETFSFPWMYWLARSAYRTVSGFGLLVPSSTPEEVEGTLTRDFAKRMSPIQEWLLKRRQVDLAEQVRRRALKAEYDSALARAGVRPLELPGYADPVLACYPVRVNEKPKVLELARRRRIELGDWYRNPVDHPTSRLEIFGYRAGTCPIGEGAGQQVVTLPMHPRITRPIVSRTVSFIRDFVRADSRLD